jgi:hypothetical protein
VAQRLTHQVGLPICQGSVHLPACAHGVQAVYALQTAQPGFKLRGDGRAHVKLMIRLYDIRPSIYLDAGPQPGCRGGSQSDFTPGFDSDLAHQLLHQRLAL